MNLNYLAMTGLVFALAGCSGSANMSGSVTYAGNGDGSEYAQKNCGNGVTFSDSGAVTGGSVTLTVRDANGVSQNTHTLSMTSAGGTGKALSGAAGDWSITGDRSSGFAGTYSASITCR